MLAPWGIRSCNIDHCNCSLLIRRRFLLSALQMIFWVSLMFTLISQSLEMKFSSAVVDSTEGFLHEWWSPFYDTYASRQLKYQPAKEGAPIQVVILSKLGFIFFNFVVTWCIVGGSMIYQVTQMTHNDQQRTPPSTIPQVPMNRHWPGPLPVIADHVKFGAPSACILARKMYEEDCLRHHTATFNPNLGPLDVNKPSFPMSAAIGSR